MTALTFELNPQFRRWRAGCWVLGGLFAVGLNGFGRAGLWPLVVVLAWIDSPGITLTISAVIEETPLGRLINLRRASWAYLFGDTIWLPLSLGAAAAAWGHDTTLPLHDAWWWPFAAPATGLGVALAFRALDTHNYRRAGEAGRLIAPSKLWHDFGTYGSLATALTYLGLPVLISGLWLSRPVLPSLVVSGLIGWMFMGLLDLVRGLKPSDLHPEMEPDWFSIRTPVGIPSSPS